ncbi:MAG: dipeptide ABC transporter ATP-binding protein [Acidobacteriota bacterium]|nr:dipeptide ABC transporter ATP-binding protein [Acidobacteriota bacterium]MDE3189399.1 dipeptide ABC transporter ATP-binding protein [Acidobacteriota bacterium]
MGPPAVDPATRRTAQRPAEPDRRVAAEPHQRPPRLHLPSALPVHAAARARDRAAARGGRAGASRSLPPLRRRKEEAVAVAAERAPGAEVDESLLVVRDLVKHFPIRKGVLQREVARVHAVDGIEFDVRRGETFGLVGESGCGKSTTARLITRLLAPTSGSIVYDGKDISSWTERRLRPLRRDVQMIFQDPYASLNPRRSIGTIIGEPLRLLGVSDRSARRVRVREVMERVGLNPEHYNRYPHEFSGGQRQRIGIARAIVLEPKLIVADEPVSALDVSIQAQVLNLLQELRDEMGLTLVFIAHDLSVVRHMCDRIAVMYLGKIVELATGDRLYAHPRHPYTGALMSAVPVPKSAAGRGRRRVVLAGDVPSPVSPPPACRFHTRCWKAQQICREEEPPLESKGEQDVAACHFPLSEGEVDALTRPSTE